MSKVKTPVAVLGLVLVVGLLVVVNQFLLTEGKTKKEVWIRPTGSAGEVARLLAREGVIRFPWLFELEAELFGLDRRLKSGRYEFGVPSAEPVVLYKLVRGQRLPNLVTIPEGLTMKQTASLLAQASVTSERAFLAACRDRTLLDSLGIPAASCEGYLFPDTYDFPFMTNARLVVRVLARNFRETYRTLEASASPPPDLSRPEFVTLASIVEREARLPAERPIIASVFLNRLHKGLPLQSCATVEYALPSHKPRLTYQDLATESPYNTYLHPGLPPGPICSPGRSSLAAVLKPAATDYLYFVAQGDGSHHFSRTGAEHSLYKQKRNRQK